MIQTIIFDFGGVVSVGKFFPVVAENISKRFEISKELLQSNLYSHEEKYMRGIDSTEVFWKNVCKDLNVPLEEFTQIFATSYTLNQGVVELITKLGQNYQVILHSDNFEALSLNLRKDPLLKDLFERVYFSNEIHLVKSEEAAFRHILSDLGREAGECVFIDDKEKNLLIPKNIGINTVLFKTIEQLKKDLASLGVV